MCSSDLVIRKYLRFESASDLPVLHQRFLDAYNCSHWDDLPTNDLYIWEYLATHLLEANRKDILLTIVRNIRYIATKAVVKGISHLLQDLRLALRNAPNDTLLELLHQHIIRIVHILGRGQSRQEVAGTLVSHLRWTQGLEELGREWEQRGWYPMLSAWYPLPSLPDTTLRCTLEGHKGAVTSHAISADDSFIVSASSDYTLKIWGASTGIERFTLTGHTNGVTSCAISTDDSFIVSASYDHTLKVWDASTGTERFTLSDQIYKVRNYAISADSDFIVMASSDRMLKVWDAHTGTERFMLTGPISKKTEKFFADVPEWFLLPNVQTHLAISADNSFIVSASDENDWEYTGAKPWIANIWDAHTGTERFTLIGHTGIINDCAISADGSTIVSGSADGKLKVWDTHTGKELPTTFTGHMLDVNSCAISTDGSFIVSASHKTLKVWDAHTGAERFTLIGHTGIINDCAISADDSFIVSTSSDKTLKVWDAHTGAERFTLTGHTDSVNSCAISADGSFIVSAPNDRLSGDVPPLDLDGSISVLSSLPRSSRTALKIWNVQTGKECLTITGHTKSVNDCAISADGSFIVSASNDKTLKVWNASTGTERFTLTGHTDSVNSCAISTDGSFIVSASNDKTLKVWDSQNAQCMATFYGNGAFSACAVSPDGEHLTAVGAQGIYFLRLIR